MPFRCALVQMCSGADIDANLEVAGRRIAEAASEGAALVALPENFALMPDGADALTACARDRSEDIDAFLGARAREHGIVLVGGSFPVPSADEARIHGTCRVYDADGSCLASYAKMHLFDVVVSDTESYRESAYTAHGSEIVDVATDVAHLGLSICYDVRFPELYRELVHRGAQVLSVPSAFTVPTGRVHWEVLLRARAIENQCFVIAPAQVGEHENGRKTYGDSIVIGPWGDVLARLPEGEGVCCADIDLDVVEKVRERLPALSHRRLRGPQ